MEEIGKTTQLFLLHLGIRAILAYMPLALKSALRFVIAEEEAKRLWGFVDIDGHTLMMLFVVADERGKGVGSKLLEYGIAAHAISEFTVNGQSPQAIGPHKQRGHTVRSRSDIDEQGDPRPVLLMGQDPTGTVPFVEYNRQWEGGRL